MPTRPAHAKLNLILSVGAPEPADAPEHPSWHRILSWFACIDLADEVSVERLGDGGASRYDIAWADDAPAPIAPAEGAVPRTIDWPLDKDLAVRAHRALEAKVGRALPVHLRVRKRIPTGAGLGGGSSDAAAALLAIRDACAIDMTTDDLRALGATLGSDVPFFIDEGDDGGAMNPPRPAVVGGFGEEIERTERVKGEVILVIPPYPCATPEVYKAFDAILAEEQREDAHRRALNDLQGPARSWGPREQLVCGRVEKMMNAGRVDTTLLVNDLARAAFAVEPRLGKLATDLARVTRMDVHMTGSGSCLFLVVPGGKQEWTMERARRVAEGAVVMATRVVG